MSDSNEDALLARITTNPAMFGGKPIIRGHRLAVEHVLGMLTVRVEAQRFTPWRATSYSESVAALLRRNSAFRRTV